MRIATYNVEWFNALFDDAGQLLNDGEWSGRVNITRAAQIEALVTVFRALNADAVLVIEAPDINRARDGRKALEVFAAHAGIRARKALVGFANDTQQEIMLLFDPDRLSARHDPRGGDGDARARHDVPRFDGTFRIDLDHDGVPETVRWSKPPLEIAAKTKGGHAFRMIGVHAKSKAPYRANTPADIVRVAIENRRKQLAECIWLRQRIEEHLGAGEDLIVLGDFNDGPGIDSYERLFGRSSIEIALGEEGAEQLFDPHARMALARPLAAAPTTARFHLPKGNYLEALLDYIMVSKKLHDLDPVWRIWHPFDDPVCYGSNELCNALLIASDHFPVSIDLAL